MPGPIRADIERRLREGERPVWRPNPIALGVMATLSLGLVCLLVGCWA